MFWDLLLYLDCITHVQVARDFPVRLMTHSSFPSTYAAASTQQEAAAKIFRSVSWAQQLELQEPPHDDSFDSPHMAAHMAQVPAMSDTSAVQDIFVNQNAVEPSLNVTGIDGVLPSADVQSRSKALDDYYKAKQAAASVVSQKPAVHSAAAAASNLVSEEGSVVSLQPQVANPVATRVAALDSLASQDSPMFAPKINGKRSAGEEIVGLPARRASLNLSVPQARGQVKVDAFSPGKPGLRSQLSKMMEEVAQARSEVLGLQSQLSAHSRLGFRSSSTASSLVSGDSVADAV